MQVLLVSKASAIVSKEWKKVKASEKKTKKYKDLYEEEKQRREEALQRYQEDHADEMEIINLNKKCNKKDRKEPKKASGDPSEEEQKSKKKTDGKKTTTKQPQKVTKIPEFSDTDSDVSDNEQEPGQLQKASKTHEYSDDEQGATVKRIVMYSTEGEQEPVIKQPQKASKVPKFVDTDSDDSGYEQPKKVSKTAEYSDDDQESTPK